MTQHNFLKWKEPEPFAERLEQAKEAHAQDNYEPNCFGTAFHLLGVLPYDQVIFTNDDNRRVQAALKTMDEHSSPQDESILIARINEHIVHAAYIRQARPLRGYHRIGAGRPLYLIKRMNDIDDYVEDVFGKKETRYLFYTQRESLDPWAKEITAEYRPLWFA